MSNSLSTFDKIKIAVGAFGGIAGGVFIAFGPPQLRQEIPIHFELGMGFIAFGVFILLALFSVRAKSFVLFIATGLLSAAGAVAILNTSYTTWQFYLFSLWTLVLGGWSIYCLYAVFSGEDPAK